MGAHATVVGDVLVIFAERDRFPRPDGFVVAVVCSFNPDEPIEAIVEAAAMLPDVTFFVTGDPKCLSSQIAATLPANVKLTGFLSTAMYGGLITEADAVLVLTSRDHTMLRGAYEAIYQGTPVIVSNWQLLRENFSEGAIHVDNSAAQIADAVRAMRQDHHRYRTAAARLREMKRRRWAETRDTLVSRLAPPRPSGRGPSQHGS